MIVVQIVFLVWGRASATWIIHQLFQVNFCVLFKVRPVKCPLRYIHRNSQASMCTGVQSCHARRRFWNWWRRCCRSRELKMTWSMLGSGPLRSPPIDTCALNGCSFMDGRCEKHRQLAKITFLMSRVDNLFHIRHCASGGFP